MKKGLLVLMTIGMLIGASQGVFAYPGSVTVDSFSNGCAEYNACETFSSVFSVFFEAGTYNLAVASGEFLSSNVPYGVPLFPPAYFWGMNIYQPGTAAEFVLGDYSPYDTQGDALNANIGKSIQITQPAGGDLLFYVRDDIVRDNVGSVTVDVTVVPEPVSSLLFILGGVVFAGRRYWKKTISN